MARWIKVPGVVLSGGLPEANVSIYVYEPGTTTEIPVYSDEGYTEIEQPILSDEAGAFFFFVDQETYPSIRVYFEKTGLDFTSMNELYDGITLP
ncbi:MAG: hypothetical protein QXZ06_05155 [Candidatus Jordarchaeales archaeon]